MAGYWEALFPWRDSRGRRKVLMLPARAVRPEAREDCGDDAVRSACAAAVPELRGAAGACRDHRGARLGGGVLSFSPWSARCRPGSSPAVPRRSAPGTRSRPRGCRRRVDRLPRQEQEAFEVAAAFVDDAVDLPCGGVRGGRRCRRSGAARLLRPRARAGSYSTGIRFHHLRHARRRQARDRLSPHREWAGGGVYRWRGDYGLLGQGRRRCPHISSRLRRQTRLAKSRQHLVRDRANRRSR